MSRAEELRELAERVKKATGPDRALDAEVATAIGWANVSPAGHGFVGHCPNKFFGSVPQFTASIDAAMTLIPESAKWEISRTPYLIEEGKSRAFVGGALGIAATPALALTAACLRALAEQEQTR